MMQILSRETNIMRDIKCMHHCTGVDKLHNEQGQAMFRKNLTNTNNDERSMDFFLIRSLYFTINYLSSDQLKYVRPYFNSLLAGD
jgi:hypothetical protein